MQNPSFCLGFSIADYRDLDRSVGFHDIKEGGKCFFFFKLELYIDAGYFLIHRYWVIIHMCVSVASATTTQPQNKQSDLGQNSDIVAGFMLETPMLQ